MRCTPVLLMLLTLTLIPPARAWEVAGVRMPATTTVQGVELKRSGMGLRTKFLFRVYVACLYLEQLQHDGAQVIAADQVKQMVLALLRDVDQQAMTQAIAEGFGRAAGAELSGLSTRLKQLASALPDLKAGQHLALTYVPGQGTHVSMGGSVLTTIAGKDFADALFAVWLGNTPVDEPLKQRLLGER